MIEWTPAIDVMERPGHQVQAAANCSFRSSSPYSATTSLLCTLHIDVHARAYGESMSLLFVMEVNSWRKTRDSSLYGRDKLGFTRQTSDPVQMRKPRPIRRQLVNAVLVQHSSTTIVFTRYANDFGRRLSEKTA